MMAKYFSNGVNHLRNHRYGQDRIGNVYLSLLSRASMFVMPAAGTAGMSATTSIQLPSAKLTLENVVINKSRWIQLTDGAVTNMYVNLDKVECLWPYRYHTIIFGFSDSEIANNPNMLPAEFVQRCTHVVPLIEEGDINQSFIYSMTNKFEFSSANIFFNFFHYTFLYGEIDDVTNFITRMETQINIAGMTIPSNVGVMNDYYSLAVNFKKT